MRRMLFLLAVPFAICSQVHAGDADVTKALAAIVGAESCQFTVKTNANESVEAKHQKNAPLYVRADGIEFFRKADVLVYKQGDAWQRTRTGTLSDPLRILGASAKVRATRTPQEDLAPLAKALTNVKKSNDAMAILFSGDLSAEVAKQLARTEDRDLARGGTAKFWLDAKGQLTKYEIAIRVQGKRGNADVDGTMTRTVTISGVGTTKVDVPAAAKEALK